MILQIKYINSFHYRGRESFIKENILLIQKKTSLTPIIGTIDAITPEYRTFNEENDDFSTYLNTFDNKSIINIVHGMMGLTNSSWRPWD